MSSEEKIVAYVIIVVEVGKEYDVLGKLRSFENVTEARVVYGEYDLVARVEVESIKKLEKIIMEIRRIPGVLRSATLISA
ncbi:MAG TPA: Lrp/AsnC family transcriptional regulator [Thermoprotei archaeon]|nr:Lrp/AsnC family transcriptional regulator [Thermoprotei archaeon]